ncbi:hypothetical protein BAE44_0026288 [Dichanthelium oligosanthes]|uniref:DUF4220 domain-containing protein n=1 Tax=Dichanthelium oligosanthes TaxID=888268 RepID=A0A1E5UIJ7_9POAL|nr:hypothetical protein BAE44_0026288 [Dichanthelium oligosanthes]
MAAAEVVAHAWNAWGIQSLVLLSFSLQATLLVLAEFRRRINSGVLRLFVWSAYMLADATAIYVLGHMSVTSRSPEHELMPFWAPFLLLHLGGQDNITAYAIEDNRLWLRHLQTLAVQVAAAGYVVYESSIVIVGIHSSSLLSWATVLMFVVGAAKYGERVWALRCAGSSPMGMNYRTFEAYSATTECQYYLDGLISTGPWDTEAYLLMAHRMLDVPMDLLKGPLGQDTIVYPFAPSLRGEDLYKVVEMQLSLMHDVFYTKAEVMHSNLYVLLMHILVAVATATAFLLFLLLVVTQGGDHHGKDNRLDVAVTYVLLVGAVVLETVSLLRAIFSSWTCPLLKHTHTTKAEAVEALSNYMMFLLAADPYMLSPTASRSTSYIEVCYGLTTRGPRYTSAEELASALRSYGDGLLAAETGSMYTLHRDYGFRLDFTTQLHLRLILQTGCKLGAKLISEEQDAAAASLEVLAQVWVETLCYAAQQCSADSHAKQLSNGGDLITVAALLVKYLTKQNFPTAGTRFDPQRWHRGGPFGSPLPNEEDETIFSLARAEALHLSPNHAPH